MSTVSKTLRITLRVSEPEEIVSDISLDNATSTKLYKTTLRHPLLRGSMYLMHFEGDDIDTMLSNAEDSISDEVSRLAMQLDKLMK